MPRCIFSYAPNRTSEYDICLIKDALNPAYKLRNPDLEMDVRITAAVEGRFDPGSMCNVCIRLVKVVSKWQTILRHTYTFVTSNGWVQDAATGVITNEKKYKVDGKPQ